QFQRIVTGVSRRTMSRGRWTANRLRRERRALKVSRPRADAGAQPGTGACVTAAKIREFHDAFGVERGVTDQNRQLRARLIAEEAQEAVEALKAEPLDREAVAKELADLLVVTYGTADVLGIDLDAAFDAVHE